MLVLFEIRYIADTPARLKYLRSRSFQKKIYPSFSFPSLYVGVICKTRKVGDNNLYQDNKKRLCKHFFVIASFDLCNMFVLFFDGPVL